jgi:2-haloacid dehalogenase
MARAVVFDVNETLLDLAALDPLFRVWFGDTAARKAWFALALHLAMTLAATRAHRGFGDVGAAALHELAKQRNVALPDHAVELLRHGMQRLPAHPDVEQGLRLLQDAGLTLAALSNNPLPVITVQMQGNGLAGYFSALMSVDEAGALKPSPEVYHFACRRL